MYSAETALNSIHLGEESACEDKSLAQEHNTVSPGRAVTRTAQPGESCTLTEKFQDGLLNMRKSVQTGSKIGRVTYRVSSKLIRKGIF